MKNKMIVKGNIQVAGVYVLRDAEGVVRYVGSGISVADRLSSHLYYLKRNLYAGTNKQMLQDIYDRGELIFDVLKISASNNDVAIMTSEQKINLQEALSVLEQFYLDLNKSTVVNKQRSVKKHSSNKDENSTYLRQQANTGSKNPNFSYSEELIANILFLKEVGLKPREIIKLLLENDIKVTGAYISRIGVDRWIYLESKCPEWYTEEVAN